MNTASAFFGRHSTMPLAAVLTTLASVPGMADAATGIFADRNATLLSLDAQYLNDSGTGAHFAGSRVTSVLDAGVSTYYSSGGGRTEYWTTRPGIPDIQVGNGVQTVSEHYGLTGVPNPATVYQVPKTGGGNVGVSVGYLADTHATASLANGILRSSAENVLAGPGVASLPAAPYEGFGAFGTAYARAEVADYLTASTGTTLKLAGLWEGRLSAGAAGSGLAGLGGGAVLAVNPVEATAHMQIGIWSAPQPVFHPGDEETPGYFTSERSYLGGIELQQTVTYGQPTANLHQPFDVSVAVPAGNFYFYASQWVSTGGQTDPSQGTGGPVFADASSSADFSNTLQFNLTPGFGASLTSESGQFLSAVPEPEEWAGLSGLALTVWALARRQQPRRFRH